MMAEAGASTDRAGSDDALAGLARVLAELAGVGQHGGGGGGGGAATYRVFIQTQSIEGMYVTVRVSRSTDIFKIQKHLGWRVEATLHNAN